MPGGGEPDGGGVGRFLTRECIAGSWESIIGLSELLRELAYNCCAKVSLLLDRDGFRGVCVGGSASGS